MKKIFFVCFMLCIITVLGGCNNPKKENETERNDEVEAETVVLDSEENLEDSRSEIGVHSEVQEEQKQGLFLLEDCIGTEGLYYAFDDGSFNLYRTGGYCLGGKAYVDGMYLANDAMHLPVDSSYEKIVLFWESDYTLNLYPVTAQVPAIQIEKDDGTKGFSVLEYSGTPVLKVSYRNNEHERIVIQTINGEPPEKYETEHVEFTVNPYKGVPSEEVLVLLDGFKANTEVKIGIAQGTMLEEKIYDVDATYYHTFRDSNHYDEEDSYYIKATPTSQGYAELDFSEIPNGKYVMVLWYNGFSNYRATLLELKRN